MILFHKEFGQGKPLVILHGLFGFSDNWQSHAKHFSTYFRVVLLDLRNHGRSQWSESHGYEEMASDVAETLDELAIPKAHFIGHSMGGKVLMHLALSHPSYIDKMVVVDMGIKSYPMHHQDIISAIRSVSLNDISARSQVNEQLKDLIPQEGVRQFLLKNLFWKEKGVLEWRMNFNVLVRHMDHILSELPHGDVLHEALFIRGQRSNYILDDDIEAIESQFLDSHVTTINNAGHWVHSEAPEEFAETTLGFLLR